jgi:hypothetical protein
LCEDESTALDQRDFPPNDAVRQRRLSQFSYRGPAGDGGPSLSPRKSPQQHSPSVPFSRPRINTMMLKSVEMAHNATSSPLAQMYNPLVVDDDMVAHDQEESEAHQHASGPALSYGPLSRRRFMSTNRRTVSEISAPASSSQAPGVRRGDTTPTSSRLAEQESVSQSPDERLEPETAEQAEEEEEAWGGVPGLMRRLSVMEQRERRIEDLLVQLNQKVKSG